MSPWDETMERSAGPLAPRQPPPFPRVVLGAGRWARIIKVLSAGTKLDRQIAETIRTQIEAP